MLNIVRLHRIDIWSSNFLWMNSVLFVMWAIWQVRSWILKAVAGTWCSDFVAVCCFQSSDSDASDSFVAAGKRPNSTDVSKHEAKKVIVEFSNYSLFHWNVIVLCIFRGKKYFLQLFFCLISFSNIIKCYLCHWQLKAFVLILFFIVEHIIFNI